MVQRPTQNALTDLDRIIADAKARLAANPDYIALKALEKARAEIVGISTKHMNETLDLVMADLNQKAADGTLFTKKVSQLAGAALALEKVGHPLPADELMAGAMEEGAVMGGNKPLVSFGSSLSKSEKFKSVRWNGDYAWWFSDRPLPPVVSRRTARLAAE